MYSKTLQWSFHILKSRFLFIYYLLLLIHTPEFLSHVIDTKPLKMALDGKGYPP